MEYDVRSELIKGLANAVTPDNNIDTSNYIDSSQTLDCTAMGISMDSLEKTKNVIESHERKLAGERNSEAHQYLLHLKIARKCVEEVMARKRESGS